MGKQTWGELFTYTTAPDRPGALHTNFKRAALYQLQPKLSVEVHFPQNGEACEKKTFFDFPS